ncbi:MAG: hypothetical protein P8L47_01450, partial [Candidatus Marinamargulisbacteria bacterium]|nr:hypothetical protein [Candidatus Marinamargulisbacteria bacterium]
MSSSIYKINIDESNFGLRAAREQSNMGEFFYEMIEPKLPGSLEAKLELVKQKKAFQRFQTDEKKQWEKNVLLHNMGTRLFDEDRYFSFFNSLKNRDKNTVIQNTQDTIIRDYLVSQKNNNKLAERPSLDSLFGNSQKSVMQTLYETLWVDSGMDHGYHRQPYQRSIQSIEADLKANRISSVPLSLILGIDDRNLDVVAPLSYDEFMSRLNNEDLNEDLSDEYAFKTLRYMAAVHHGYIQSRQTFQQNQETIQGLGSSYNASEKQAITAVSWEMLNSPIENIFKYQHLKDNGHMYFNRKEKKLTAEAARDKLDPSDWDEWNAMNPDNIHETEFEYAGMFKDTGKEPYDRFIYQTFLFDGELHHQWYTEKEGAGRKKFSVPSSENPWNTDRRAINFNRINQSSIGANDRVGNLDKMVFQSTRYLLTRYLLTSESESPASSNDIQDDIQEAVNALSTYFSEVFVNESSPQDNLNAIANLFAKTQNLIPGIGTEISDINDEKLRVWGDLYPITTVLRSFSLASYHFIDDTALPSQNRDEIITVLKANDVIWEYNGQYILIKELDDITSDDLIDID